MYDVTHQVYDISTLSFKEQVHWNLEGTFDILLLGIPITLITLGRR